MMSYELIKVVACHFDSAAVDVLVGCFSRLRL